MIEGVTTSLILVCAKEGVSQCSAGFPFCAHHLMQVCIFLKCTCVTSVWSYCIVQDPASNPLPPAWEPDMLPSVRPPLHLHTNVFLCSYGSKVKETFILSMEWFKKEKYQRCFNTDILWMNFSIAPALTNCPVFIYLSVINFFDKTFV